MFLTHIDEEGRDSPAILIENATAANRAANIPEFVNLAGRNLRGSMCRLWTLIAVSAMRCELTRKGEYDEAIALWNRVLAMSPGDPKAHNNLGFALARRNRPDEALASPRNRP